MATVPIMGTTSARFQKRCRVKREPSNRSPQRENCSLRRAKRPLFLTKMTKKVAVWSTSGCNSPFGNGKNRFFRQKRTKSGSSKKKEPGRGSNPNPKRQARSLNPIITMRQNGYGAHNGHYFGMRSKTLPDEKEKK